MRNTRTLGNILIHRRARGSAGRCRYYYRDDAPGARPLGPPAAGGRSPRVVVAHEPARFHEGRRMYSQDVLQSEGVGGGRRVHLPPGGV